MTNPILFLSIIVAVFFLIYGIQCLRSPFMKEEFIRYGMGDGLRILTGTAQLAGAAGLLAGLYISLLGLLATTGLTVMMAVAFGTRIKVRDSLNQTLPSFFFMLVNGFLAYKFLLLMLYDL
ncbi:DoxX family protein [Gracilimonas sediminicola]|uniref:DoxX family protein n=1 Tax=Gracilimonas sediminicola TaxID=2952158 RepID=A0A9X2L397_9BACT|nr:DoxX family protein [Gracilimonas sediminicola]MCP9291541.1 DoxX family protein [Gracilimonas sediminicola]